jgi:putative phage-type endonuclease
MSARLVLPHDAPRDAWLAARRGGVTASEIATLLGISPFDSPFNLFWQKAGVIPDDYDNERLSLGRHLEPWIAERFTAEHPDLRLTAPAGLWASVDRPWQFATPDGLIHDSQTYGVVERDGVLEVEPAAVWEGKTSGTYDEWGADGSDEIPAYIRAQVLWQMDVMGVEVGYVSCLFLSSQQIRNYVVEYDAADVHLMRARAQEFLDQIERGDPPPIDHHHATTAALKHLFPAVDEDETAEIPMDVAESYRWAKAALKAAQEQADHAENALRNAMAGAKQAVDPDGVKVASRSIYERAGYTTSACTIDRLNPARAKKETS